MDGLFGGAVVRDLQVTSPGAKLTDVAHAQGVVILALALEVLRPGGEEGLSLISFQSKSFI